MSEKNGDTESVIMTGISDSIFEAIAKTKAEILKLQRVLKALEVAQEAEGKKPSINIIHKKQYRGKQTIGSITLEILQERQEQMHVRDLIPLISEKYGSEIDKRSLPTILNRMKGIRKVKNVPSTYEAEITVSS